MNVLIAADAAKRRFKMKSFTIENETNNITIHATVQDAEAVANAERFRNEGGFAKLAADWPAARLVDVWNSLPGATRVKKFKDRATAVNRIWKAIQSLGDTIQTETTNDPEVPAVIETAQTPEIAEAPPDRSIPSLNHCRTNPSFRKTRKPTSPHPLRHKRQ